MFERLIKRTIFIAQCECGDRTEVTHDAPKERLCKCGKWVPYIEQSAIGPDLTVA